MRARLVAVIGLCMGIAALDARSQDLWGCQVLLCLSDRRGPMAEAECVPPIQRLFRQLARGGGFPSCAEAGGTRAYSQSASEYWCPNGYLMPHPDLKDQHYCMAAGSVDVLIDGQPWQRVWWGITSDFPREPLKNDYTAHFSVPLGQR